MGEMGAGAFSATRGRIRMRRPRWRGLVEAVRGLTHGESTALDVRAGIATGLAVVGDVIGEGGAREEAAVGEVPNLAARLQQIAAPGAVVVAPGTRALLGQVFELECQGRQSLKGIAKPVEVWCIVGEQSVETRFEAVRPAIEPSGGAGSGAWSAP
jgi:class 3 adenylate cyclase